MQGNLQPSSKLNERKHGDLLFSVVFETEDCEESKDSFVSKSGSENFVTPRL